MPPRRRPVSSSLGRRAPDRRGRGGLRGVWPVGCRPVVMPCRLALSFPLVSIWRLNRAVPPRGSGLVVLLARRVTADPWTASEFGRGAFIVLWQDDAGESCRKRPHRLRPHTVRRAPYYRGSPPSALGGQVGGRRGLGDGVDAATRPRLARRSPWRSRPEQAALDRQANGNRRRVKRLAVEPVDSVRRC